MGADPKIQEHLFDAESLDEFRDAMMEQLLNHKDDKIGMKNWHSEKVVRNSISGITKQFLKIINTMDNLEGYPTDKQVAAINKAFTHISNYCYFGWQVCHGDEE